MRTIEPTVIPIGARVEWTRSYDDYSAADYDLEYRYRGPGPGIDVAATADGTEFNAVVTAAQSLIMSAGRYRWQAWLTEQADAANTFVIGSGFVTIEPGFTSGDTGDIEIRTAAKITLDSIDAALLSDGTVLEYTISTPAGSRTVKRSTRSELIKLRATFAGIVARENAAARVRAGKPFGITVKGRLRDD